MNIIDFATNIVGDVLYVNIKAHNEASEIRRLIDEAFSYPPHSYFSNVLPFKDFLDKISPETQAAFTSIILNAQLEWQVQVEGEEGSQFNSNDVVDIFKKYAEDVASSSLYQQDVSDRINEEMIDVSTTTIVLLSRAYVDVVSRLVIEQNQAGGKR